MNFLFIVFFFDQLLTKHLLASVLALHFIVFRLELCYKFSLDAGCGVLGVNVLRLTGAIALKEIKRNYFTNRLPVLLYFFLLGFSFEL